MGGTLPARWPNFQITYICRTAGLLPQTTVGDTTKREAARARGSPDTMSEAMLDISRDEIFSGQNFAGRPFPDLIGELQRLYLEDERPWVIGFSGGKDSTAVLSLIYTAVEKIQPEERHKHVYVVCSDTLVETPVVVDLITTTLEQINARAKDRGLPFSAHQVMPKSNDTFWVNLLGKGYPAPTQSFRWCTERMKIDPVSSFIL